MLGKEEGPEIDLVSIVGSEDGTGGQARYSIGGSIVVGIEGSRNSMTARVRF